MALLPPTYHMFCSAHESISGLIKIERPRLFDITLQQNELKYA